MYSFGSVSAVGSWFCISVTRRVRKSFAEMVAESSAELLLAAAAWLLTDCTCSKLCAAGLWFHIPLIGAAIVPPFRSSHDLLIPTRYTITETCCSPGYCPVVITGVSIFPDSTSTKRGEVRSTASVRGG